MDDAETSGTSSAAPAVANPFGITEALLGLAFGFVLSALFAGGAGGVFHHGTHASSYGEDVAGLIGLWIGFVGAAVLAVRAHSVDRRVSLSTFCAAYGLKFRPLIDIPVGAAVGVGSQYLLVPLFELPLRPFVPHLSERLSGPANSLTNHVNGAGLVILGLLVCIGSPFVEELFFRGLLFRGLLGRLTKGGSRAGLVGAILVTGVVFGLVHFEALQLTALIGFGCVLAVLAYVTRRLGPGIVAHAAFNATTIIAIARTH